ncbi:PREDICTED: metallothionein-like protein 2 [Nelumbo nucifera]|uniref:Metallothionein-like protein n=1 Tax=Nelumbo nucifera TaxID=4432 RepID=A3FPG1_NELNU|nr:PREDICTED: metallothionein-like protein 2 [Nelumbo nucifera]ABN46988.1 metallothionein-like protein 2b [Nelumbo nucifera]
MSCGGNCGCGSGCSCGGGCKKYLDMSFAGEKTTTETIVVGVAPQKTYSEASEMNFGAENEGCGCGSNCSCDPCNCK